MQGVDRAEGPVAEIKGLLILRRELRAVAERHADGRAGADVDHGRQAVDVIRRPLAGAAPPAELAAAGRMDRAGRAIPGHAHVPFHVRVIGEQLAVGVEGDVVAVAIAAADDFPGLAVGVGAGDPAAGGEDAAGVAVGVPLARQELVFAPVSAARRLDWKPSGVCVWLPATSTIDLPSGVSRRPCGPCSPPPRIAFKCVDLVVLVVAVGVAQAIEADSPDGRCRRHKGCRTRRASPVRPMTAAFSRSTFVSPLPSERRRRDAAQPLVAFVADDQAALVVEREADPRAEFVARHGEEPLDPEPRQELRRSPAARRGWPAG